jgi:hypothetical protein
VASKLLSPSLGMVAGCALLVDYVLTITVSICSGADAIFSFLPAEWNAYLLVGFSPKMLLALASLAALTIMNLRGVKESISMLLPIFAVFLVIIHLFAYDTVSASVGIGEFADKNSLDLGSLDPGQRYDERTALYRRRPPRTRRQPSFHSRDPLHRR